MNYDKILSKIFFIDDWHFNQSYLNKYKRNYKKQNKYKNIINYINNRYSDSESFKETLYRMNHYCEIRPVCKTCGNKVKFIGKCNKLFSSFCCNRCSGINKETIDKKQQSDKHKHNGKLGWNINTPEKIQARKDSLIKKYGTWENACKEIEILHKNGVKNKYGVDSVMDIDDIKIKRNNTLKERCIYNKSKTEEQTYEILLKYFNHNDIIRQYTSKQYPWACDFYIISLDLYIECHYSHFHNFKEYIGNESDINEINLLTSKSNSIKEKTGKLKTQYDMIIYTWSILDVKKKNTAINNKLNYKVFYNIEDVYKWLENKKSST